MNHQEVRRRMGGYLQGDLALEQRALLDAHLDGCASCAEELRALRTTVQLLRELPTPDVPSHLADRVVARIQDGEGRARWWDGLGAFWNAIDPARYLPPLAAAAMTSAVVIVGVRDLGWEIPGLHAPPERKAVAAAEEAPVAPARPAAPSEAGRTPSYVYEVRPSSNLIPGLESEADVVRLQRSTPFLPSPFGSRAAPEPPGTRSAEEDLELALADPRGFLLRFRALRPPESQEAWLAAVAEHAARRRSVERVIQGLRSSAGPEGHDLATRFEGAARSVAYPAEAR